MELSLFDAIKAPYRGLRTYPDSSAVPQGYWKDARNIRTDSGAIKLRGGQTQLVDNSSLSGDCVGSCLVEFGANTYLFTALTISGAVRIYYNVYNGSWGSATEVTASSGFFGNTRMATPSKGLVSFTKVYSKTDGLCVVIQDGSSSPRVVKMSAIAAGNARTIAEVPAPQEIGGYSPSFGITAFLDIHTFGGYTPTSGAGTFAFSESGGASPVSWNFTTGAGAMVDGDYAQLTSSATLDLNDAKQIFIIAEVSTEAIFASTKWELVCNTTNVVIHDPENGIDNIVSAESNEPGLRTYAFPLGENSPSERVPGGGGSGLCTGLRITCTNTNIPVNATAVIRAICTGGRVPGFAEYSQTWYCSGSMTESPEVVLKNPVQGATHNEMFAGVKTTLPEDFRLPLTDAFFYKVKQQFICPDSDLLAAGVDYVRLYRRDPGETVRTYYNQVQTGVYTSSWAYSSPYTSTARTGSTNDIFAPEDKVYERIAPDAFNEPVPIGQAALWASSRHYVGTYKASSTEPKSVIKVSEQDEPFRFASIPREDLTTSAYLAQLSGEEVVISFQAVSSSVIGSSVVYCFSNRGMYALDGTLIRRISSIGALATGAVSENQNRLFWVDQNLSIRRSSGTIEDLSRLRIDDILLAATNTDKLASVFHRDRFYLSYSGGVLVWSDLLGDWESRDTPGVQPVQFLPWRVSNTAKLYFVGSGGSLYEYESGTTDAGSQIAFLMQTPDMHGRNWNRATIEKPSVVCSDVDSETLTVTFTASKPAGTQVGTLSLDAGGSETITWREAKRSTGGPMGLSGASLNVTFSATLPGPFTVKGLQIHEVKEGAGVGRDN